MINNNLSLTSIEYKMRDMAEKDVDELLSNLEFLIPAAGDYIMDKNSIDDKTYDSIVARLERTNEIYSKYNLEKAWDGNRETVLKDLADWYIKRLNTDVS